MSRVIKESPVVLIANYRDDGDGALRDGLDDTLASQVDINLSSRLYDETCFTGAWIGTHAWELLIEKVCED